MPHEPGKGELPSIWQSFPRPFWLLVLAMGIFSLGNSSDSFLILRSSEIGLSTNQVIGAFMLYNVVYAAAATPLGRLSDVVGRKPIVMIGWLVYAGVYMGFATVNHAGGPWILLGIYGLYQVLTEGVTKAMVSDVVAAHQRRAIGLFYTVAGLGQLVASLIAGATWEYGLVGGRVMFPFAFGAACAVGGAIVLMMLPRKAGPLALQRDSGSRFPGGLSDEHSSDTEVAYDCGAGRRAGAGVFGVSSGRSGVFRHRQHVRASGHLLPRAAQRPAAQERRADRAGRRRRGSHAPGVSHPSRWDHAAHA